MKIVKDKFELPLAFTAIWAAVSLVITGCGKPADPSGTPAAVLKPKEAANQLQQVFVNAEPEVKKTATAASQALQTADYENAVVALSAMKERGNLTFDQGMAVHNSMVALEAKLIAAADSGDANAKRAYDLMKKTRRN